MVEIPPENTPLLEAGRITSVRLTPNRAKKLNNFASMYHIESKTECIERYMVELERKVEDTQAELINGVHCPIFKKAIAKDYCIKISSNSEFRQKQCEKLSCKVLKEARQ